MQSNSFQFIYFLILLIQVVHTSTEGNDDDPYSPSERAALNQFRPLVAYLLDTDDDAKDDNLIRFLRAKEMNVNDAVDMITETHKWRQRNRITPAIVNETIYPFPVPPYVVDGYDRNGSPLIICTPTHIDLRKMIIQGNRDKVIRLFFQMLERGRAAIDSAPKMANGRNVTQATVILDFHGYNLKQHFCLDCASVYPEWFSGMEKYFPEAMKHFVVLNIPRIAKQLIDIILPLLSPNTHRALKMFEPDKKQWGKYLLKIIAPDQLPIRFGGTRTSR